MASEEQIVARVLAGNTSEFRELVENYQLSVFRFVYNLIGDEHDAEDIVQEVFLAAFSHLATFAPNRASLQTWLFTFARNRSVNYLKRKRPLIDGETIASTLRASVDDSHAQNESRNEFWGRLDKALDALPIEQKTAFVLAEVVGVSYADIADIERITLGTVKSRIYRAKQKLRGLMAPTQGDQE